MKKRLTFTPLTQSQLTAAQFNDKGCSNSMARRQGGKLDVPAGKVRIAGDKESFDPLALHRRKGCFDLAAVAGLEDFNWQPDDTGGFLNLSQGGLRCNQIAWID
jgi:hypothetical protein